MSYLFFYVCVCKESELMIFFLLPVTEHPYFVAVQFHPEYISRPLKPSPPYLGLILAASGKLNHYLSKGCRLPSVEVESSDDESCNTPDAEVMKSTS